MGKIRSYRDDDILKPLLDSLPKRKQGEITRKALYDYFYKRNKQTIEKEISAQSIPIKTEDIKLAPVKEFKFDMFD